MSRTDPDALRQPTLDLDFDLEPAKPKTKTRERQELPFETVVDISAETAARPVVFGNPLDHPDHR